MEKNPTTRVYEFSQVSELCTWTTPSGGLVKLMEGVKQSARDSSKCEQYLQAMLLAAAVSCMRTLLPVLGRCDILQPGPSYHRVPKGLVE